MLIRENQMQTFESEMKARFARRLAAELRQEYPDLDEQMSEERLLELILEGVERAEGYGLDSDTDVETFVRLLFVVGWYFDRHPFFHDFLTEEDYEPTEKIEYMLEAATEKDWREAALYSKSEAVMEEESG